MLFLTLSNSSKSRLPAKLQEQILSAMYEQHMGFLHACETLGISVAFAVNDYRVNKQFADAVDTAERMLVMWESEKILSIADGATGFSASAARLQVAAREKMRDALLPKWREAQTPAHVEQHLHTGDTHVTLSVERQAQLREQRKRILSAVKGAHVLTGSHAGDDTPEQAQSYRIRPQSLLVDKAKT